MARAWNVALPDPRGWPMTEVPAPRLGSVSLDPATLQTAPRCYANLCVASTPVRLALRYIISTTALRAFSEPVWPSGKALGW